MRKRLIIHIGLYKTGSTALQAFLARNVSVLAASGIAYPFVSQPEIGGSEIAIGNIWLELIRLRRKYGSFCSTDEMVALFLGEAISNAIAESSQQTVLLSCEHLCSASALEIIGSFAFFHDVCIIVYVRDPYDLYVSRWKQRVKSQGETALFDDWLEIRLQEKEQSLFALIRESAHLSLGLEIISYDSHRDRLVESFLLKIGIDPTQCDIDAYRGATHNRSLSFEQAMLVTLALQNGASSNFSAALLAQFMSDPADFKDPTIHELDAKILAKEKHEILFLNTMLPANEKLRTTPRAGVPQSEMMFSAESVGRAIRTLAAHIEKARPKETSIAYGVADPGLPNDFDADEYLLRNPDVAMAGMSAGVHYMEYGRWENRVFRAGPLALSLPADSRLSSLSASGFVQQTSSERATAQPRPQENLDPRRHGVGALLQRAALRLSRRGKP